MRIIMYGHAEAARSITSIKGELGARSGASRQRGIGKCMTEIIKFAFNKGIG